MNNRAHINHELQSIAPGLIATSATMPYMLPQYYFDRFAESVVSIIQDEPAQYSVFIKTNVYTVPNGYFENLPEILLKRVKDDAAQEIETDFWSSLPKKNPYNVPPEYFDNLPSLILQQAKTQSVLTAPAGYFKSLPEQMLAKVRKLDATRELEEVAPLLNTISRQTVQHIPADYFENLKPAFGEAEKQVPVKIITSKKNRLKYAVAASIVFLFAFGSYFLFNQKSTSVPSIANQPTVTVINEQLAKLDASAIEDYLKSDNAAVHASFPENGLEKLDNTDLNEVLQGFSDQELRKQIEETPELPTATNLHT